MEKSEVPTVKRDKEVVRDAKKELKKLSKGKLINIIINLSARIDELKEDKNEA